MRIRPPDHRAQGRSEALSPRLPAGAPHPLCVSVQPWPRAKGRGLISRGGQAICLLKHTVNISVSRGWRFLGNNSPTGHPESHRALEGTSPAGWTPPPHAAHAGPARRHLPVRPSSGRVGRRVGGWRGSNHGPARAGVPVPSQAPPRGGHSCWWFLEHAWPPAPNPVRVRSRLRAATTQGAAGPATRPHRGRAPAGAADPVCPGLARAACAAVCSLCGRVVLHRQMQDLGPGYCPGAWEARALGGGDAPTPGESTPFPRGPPALSERPLGTAGPRADSGSAGLAVAVSRAAPSRREGGDPGPGQHSRRHRTWPARPVVFIPPLEI